MSCCPVRLTGPGRQFTTFIWFEPTRTMQRDQLGFKFIANVGLFYMFVFHFMRKKFCPENYLRTATLVADIVSHEPGLNNQHGFVYCFSGNFFTNCALNCLTLWYGRIKNRIMGLGQWGKCNRPWSCYTRPCDAALLTEPRVVHEIFAVGNAKNYDEHWWTGCWSWKLLAFFVNFRFADDMLLFAESLRLRQMLGIHTYCGWICTCGFMPQQYQNTGCLSRSPTTAIFLARTPRTSWITLLGSKPGTNMFGKITQAVSETFFALWPKGSSHSLTLVCWPGDFSSSTIVDWISLRHVC